MVQRVMIYDLECNFLEVRFINTPHISPPRGFRALQIQVPGFWHGAVSENPAVPTGQICLVIYYRYFSDKLSARWK